MTVLPDPTPDLSTAAWRELMKIAATLEAAGVARDSTWIPFVFNGRPERQVDGTGQCSIVVSSVRAWSSPNRHNTARFPQLQVEVYADPDRDVAQGVAAHTAQRKAEDIWKLIDPIFHRPDAGGIEWGNNDGTLLLVSSVRSSDPRTEDVPETDGVKRLTVAYDVQQWG